MDDRELSRNGVRVVLQMSPEDGSRQVSRGINLHSGSRNQEQKRMEWYKHTMSSQQLVGITGQMVQADGDTEVLALVEGQQVWEDAMGGLSGWGSQWRI